MQRFIRANVITSADAQPLRDGAIVVEEGRVAAVEPWSTVAGAAARRGAEVSDHRDRWALPGLIDLHVHLTLPGDGRREDLFYRDNNAGRLFAMAHANANAALRAGVTSMRDCGGTFDVVVGIRDAYRSGALWGPRLFVAGPPMTITGGHCAYMGGTVDGADGIRALSRRLLEAGVDYLKVMGSGGGTPGTEHLVTTYTAGELGAALAEAEGFGTHLAVHATNQEAVRVAIAAGVHTIEHAILTLRRHDTTYDPRLVDELAESGIVVSPTLAASLGTLRYLEARHAAGDLTTEEETDLERRRRYLAGRTRQIVDMLRAGVPIASSTDAGWRITHFGDFADGLDLLAGAGVAPRDVLRTATEVPASVLRRTDLGNLRAGSCADVLIVDRNPLEAIDALRGVLAVYLGGEPVVERQVRYEV